MVAIPQSVYRVDRSYAWNYGHAPSLPKVRRLPMAQGGRLFDRDINSRLGVAAGPLMNSKWVAGYARLGLPLGAKTALQKAAERATTAADWKAIAGTYQQIGETKEAAEAQRTADQLAQWERRR